VDLGTSLPIAFRDVNCAIYPTMSAFILTGGQLATAGFALRDVGFVDGRVVEKPPANAEVIDATGCLVLPGLVLGHTHLYSALACGMPGPAAAPVDFPDLLRKVWWRLDRALDSELVALSAEVGAWLAIRCGVTTLVDHHASPGAIDGSLDAVAGALSSVGVRGVVCYEVTDRNGAGERDAGLAETDRFLGRNRRPNVRGMVGGHALFTLDDAALRGAAALCEKHDVGFHVHVSEDPTDDRVCRGQHRVAPLARLSQFGLLREDTLLGHGVHLSRWERERLAESGCFIAHNPRSNQNNHVGYGVPAEMGLRVVLGTDGIGADLFAEGQAAFYAGRAHDRDFDAAQVTAWLDNARTFAAARFGEPLLGTLAPGAPADVVVLDNRAPTPIDAGSWPWHFVFTQSAAAVRDVFVAGQPRLRGRRPVDLDEADLLARSREGARRLWSRIEAIPADDR